MTANEYMKLMQDALNNAKRNIDTMMHIDFRALDDCKNLGASYGEICVKCNKCGRFDKEVSE